MPDVFEIAAVLQDHALRGHRDDIAIIAYSGSHAKGTASPTSDLDIFYLPDEGKAETLSSQFVLDGLPYDFWPMPWRFAEDIANARGSRPWAVAASLIADARILYHRSAADLQRFTGLQNHIAYLLTPAARKFMVERALDEFKEPLFQLAQMRFATKAGDWPGLRWASRRFANGAVNCLALVNQTFFSKGWGTNLAEILALPQRPAALAQLLDQVLYAPQAAQVLSAADQLAHEVRAILRTALHAIAEETDAQAVLKDYYPGVFEYKNKVLAACARGDAAAADFAAFQLQQELSMLMNQAVRGYWAREFSLLGEYDDAYAEAGFPDLTVPAAARDLPELARRAALLDARVRAWFQARGIALNELEDVDDLRRFLQARDPLA